MALIRSPVQEVAFTVQRRTPAPLHALDVAHIHGLYAERYPLFQQLDPLPPMQLHPTMEAFIEFGGQNLRYWFASEDSKFLCQLQHDRFGLNWRRLAPSTVPADYPGYADLVERFMRELEVADNWLVSRGSDAVPAIAELYYMNAVELGDRRISRLLRFFTPVDKRPLSNFQFTLRSPLPLEGEALGFLETACHIGADVRGLPVLFVSFISRMPIGESLSLNAAFDLMHDAVSENVRIVFTEEVLESFK